MKKHFAAAAMLLALAGCSSIYVPTLQEVPVKVRSNPDIDTSAVPFRLAPSHWSDVAKLSAEMQRLAVQVGKDELTRVQAAQHLNRFRLNLVGRNAVDDDVYNVYLRAAVDSQRGAISSEESKLLVERAVRGWQQRWPNMTSKPSNPAFTNAMIEILGLDKPLQ
ncbi:prokaryotic membrane lipolipid attachment site family protein [Neisseria leonii]|uniref:Prokaryotic membrane lipolipid attachment site family protein n=1 Tax=Neisseria leonii TaxID=2995413 RepID=A0A9X4E0B1_9NEIS|nr:prokaryotic membrane lipolipid attachment site family protein [Neisseria sp. 51.81]MDD9327125.1 prokaryotic membrane lipolipid attachment site family protein [Neisseria sp. 51.81]